MTPAAPLPIPAPVPMTWRRPTPDQLRQDGRRARAALVWRCRGMALASQAERAACPVERGWQRQAAMHAHLWGEALEALAGRRLAEARELARMLRRARQAMAGEAACQAIMEAGAYRRMGA